MAARSGGAAVRVVPWRCQRSMTAICASSWRSPAAGGEVVQSFDLLGAELELVGGGVLLDAEDALGARDRGNVVALRKQPTRGSRNHFERRLHRIRERLEVRALRDWGPSPG